MKLIWKIASIASVAILLWLLTSLVLSDVPIIQAIDDSSFRTVENATQMPNASSHPAHNLKVVSAIFGTTSTPKTAPSATKKIPETRLNLILKGSFTNSNISLASAILTNNNSTKTYFVGDRVPGNATLITVDTDSVVLRRNDRDEILFFPRISPKDSK